MQFRFNDSLILEGPQGGGKEDLENRQRTEVAYLRSGRVCDAAAKSDPQVLPADRLAKELKAGFSEGTPLMWVSLSGLEPQAMAASINAVTEAYLRTAGDANRRELLERSEQYDRAIADSGEAILKKKSDLRRLTDGRADDPRVKAAEADFLANSAELARTQIEIEKRLGSVSRAKARLATIDKVPVDQPTVEESLELLPQVAEAQAALVKLEGAEADIHRRFTSADEPPIRQAAEMTRRQKDTIQKIRADLVPRVEAQIRRRVKTELSAAITRDEEELAILALVEASLRKRRDAGATTAATGLPPALEMQIKAIEQDEEVLKALRVRRERLRIEVQSGASKVTIFQPAQAPTQPNYRSQALKVAAAGLGGAALGWLAVGWFETRSRRVRDARTLAHTGLRILGTIPSGAPSDSVLLRPQDVALAVSADLLRTSLQLDDRLRACRTLVVTSAAESEGKSTLAMLLAGSLARAGFRTVLIDADFRRPCLGDRLGVPPGPGLSEALTLSLVTKPAVLEVVDLPLGLVPAGGSGQAASACLSRANLGGWFASLRKDWEYVIIDAPPLLPIPDAAVLGKAADGVLLCARAGLSRIEQVHAAVDLIASLGITCLGVVLNDVRTGRPTYYGSGHFVPLALASGNPADLESKS